MFSDYSHDSFTFNLKMFTPRVAMLFFLVIAFISGCSKNELTLQAPNKALFNSKWVLQELRAHSNISSEKEVYIHFMPKEKRLAGYSGCNEFFGQYQMNDDFFSISNLSSTKMICQNMRIEDSLMQNFANAQGLTIEGTELNLHDANGVFASFKSIPFNEGI